MRWPTGKRLLWATIVRKSFLGWGEAGLGEFYSYKRSWNLKPPAEIQTQRDSAGEQFELELYSALQNFLLCTTIIA